LKTPLTSISGFIETLQNGAAEDPEARNKFIEIIAIETARLKRLIQDILILSDIESNIETSNVDFSINDIITKVIELLDPIAKQKKISIECAFHDNIYLNGNEDKFTQMIVNLVENAIKYSNEDTIVNVDTTENNNQIIINVIDHGIGIAKDDLNRISERFYRVDKSRSTKVGGTGLGLSIVKHTATLFGGDLQIKSELGKGSTFSIVINK
ncbi:MAG: ATP-binding protein, partial [Bacilli bacterium]